MRTTIHTMPLPCHANENINAMRIGRFTGDRRGKDRLHGNHLTYRRQGDTSVIHCTPEALEGPQTSKEGHSTPQHINPCGPTQRSVRNQGPRLRTCILLSSTHAVLETAGGGICEGQIKGVLQSEDARVETANVGRKSSSSDLVYEHQAESRKAAHILSQSLMTCCYSIPIAK